MNRYELKRMRQLAGIKDKNINIEKRTNEILRERLRERLVGRSQKNKLKSGYLNESRHMTLNQMINHDFDDFDDSDQSELIDKKIIRVNKKIKLDGEYDNWSAKNLKSTFVKRIIIKKYSHSSGIFHTIKVVHNGPWTIYKDEAFEKEISRIVGFTVTFSEEGLQQDGIADLED